MKRARMMSACALAATLSWACDSTTDKQDAPLGPPPAAPTFSPGDPLRFGASLEIAMATTTAGATVRYSTDENPPTAASPAYTGTISITETTTFQAIATAPGAEPSAVSSITYTRRPVNLQVDDGGVETAWGTVDLAPRHVMLNRFTPDPDDFPFQLRTISLLVCDQASQPGRSMRLVVYSDADGDPANGTTFEAEYLVTAQHADATTLSVYTPSAPVTLRGPGDVLIGQIPAEPIQTYCWPFDTSSSEQRTWWGYWDATPPAEPTLPSLTRADQWTAGNAIIRGSN